MFMQKRIVSDVPAMRLPLILWTLFLTTLLFAQSVYEPLHKDVYRFLDRIAARGVIDYHDLITPLTRQTIAKKLSEAHEKSDQLTAVEQAELNFLSKDYLLELEKLRHTETDETLMAILKKDPAERWRVFTYRDSQFSMNLNPIYGVEVGDNDGTNQLHRWNGLYFFGYFKDNIGYSFDFRDNLEKGAGIDTGRTFTPVTGVNAEYFPESESMEYSEMHATIAADWEWGRLTAGKDFLQWGYARNGKVVLSNKAPSFPFIRLDARLTDWLRFNYFHGWLASDVIDSTKMYPTLRPGEKSKRFRSKFLASHTITITPKRGIDFSIGESIVYSDQLEVAYLMPMLFFRLADHYLSDRDNTIGANAQLFFAFSMRNTIPNTHLYGELLIDDIALSYVFDEARQVNHLGGTIGAMVVDVPFPNLTLRAEYTRINPFVYKHFIPTLLYTSSSDNLGHWMGHNADAIYLNVGYQLRRGLQGEFWMYRIRKGEEGEVADQYTIPHKQFLFGLDTHYNWYGVDVKYEIKHDLFIKGSFVKRREKAQLPFDGKFHNTVDQTSIALSLYYGL
jgi:hypothetical protein